MENILQKFHGRLTLCHKCTHSFVTMLLYKFADYNLGREKFAYIFSNIPMKITKNRETFKCIIKYKNHEKFSKVRNSYFLPINEVCVISK